MKILEEEFLKLPYVDAAKRAFGVDVPEFTEGLIHNTCDEFWKGKNSFNRFI